MHIFFTMAGNMIPMFIFSFLFAYVTVLREALKQKRILEAQKLLLEAQRGWAEVACMHDRSAAGYTDQIAESSTDRRCDFC